MTEFSVIIVVRFVDVVNDIRDDSSFYEYIRTSTKVIVHHLEMSQLCIAAVNNERSDLIHIYFVTVKVFHQLPAVFIMK